MMQSLNVVFDVQGTLVGYNQTKVRQLFELFVKNGHTVSIWSNGMRSALPDEYQQYTFRSKFNKAHGRELLSWGNDPKTCIFDIAVEDDKGQSYLSAHSFIWVWDIPNEDLESWFYAKFPKETV